MCKRIGSAGMTDPLQERGHIKIVRNYLVDSAERCFFAVGKVMFKAHEHKFKAHEHMFKGGEHKFMGREHKIISV